MPGRESALPSIANPALSADPAVRGAAATGLVTVGVIHALEIQGQLGFAVWLTAGFFLLAAGAPLLGLWLLVRPSWRSWLAGGVTCAGALAGYILTRSLAVPGDPGDRGNWLEPLGLAAIIIELTIVILAALALGSTMRAAAGDAPDTAAALGQAPEITAPSSAQ